MKSQYAFALVLLNFLSSYCLAQTPSKTKPEQNSRDIITFELNKDCKPFTDLEDSVSGRICRRVEGYALLLKSSHSYNGGDAPKPEIYLITPKGQRQKIDVWNPNDPAYKGVRAIEWVVVNTPKKSVALLFTLAIEPKPDFSPYGDYDVVVRVSPGPTCIVGAVPFGSISAMQSMSIADSPREQPCLRFDELEKRDWFRTAKRLASEGQIIKAKSALEKITSDVERFIVYREISNAQYRATDVEGARRTLMTGREEALKNHSGYELSHTLNQIVYGLVEAGFYDAAKADIKLFVESEHAKMYITVAWYQSERKDLEAAKQTFREAIQLELERPECRDWHLREIVEAQARIGLIDEAKHTLSLIRDPDAKRTAEQYIPPQTPRPNQ